MVVIIQQARQGPQGPIGPTGGGTAATIEVGTTTTGDPGTDAEVVNVGTEDAAILNFTIPRGDSPTYTYPPGQALMSASLPVVIASNQSAVAVTVGSIALPTGAATETTLAGVKTGTDKIPTAGQATMSASLPVTIASNQSALAISAGSLPLPSGAATETTLGNIKTDTDKIPSQGQATMSASTPVVIASNQSAVPVSAASLPLPTGASTESTLSTASTTLTGIKTGTDKIPAAGQTTMSASLPVTIASNQSALSVTPTAGELHIGEVGTPCDVIAITPTISTSPAYTSGDCVGGIYTLTNATRVTSGVCILESLSILDKGNQKAALTCLFFNANPGAATITDNSAFAWSTDNTKCIGRFDIAAADWGTVASQAVVSKFSCGLQLKANGNANIYMAVVTSSTPTYTSTTDLIFNVGVMQK